MSDLDMGQPLPPPIQGTVGESHSLGLRWLLNLCTSLGALDYMANDLWHA